MSETRFTPGPWVASEGGGGQAWRIMAPGRGALATVHHVCLHPNTAERREGEANAALIAVAPELYEALQHITRWLMTDVDALPPHVTRDDVRVYHLDGAVLHNCLERARAALERCTPQASVDGGSRD